MEFAKAGTLVGGAIGILPALLFGLHELAVDLRV